MLTHYSYSKRAKTFIALSLTIAGMRISFSAVPLVQNGGFETTGWWSTQGPAGRVNINPHTGSYSMRATAGNNGAWQAVYVTPGTSYTLTAWGMKDSTLANLMIFVKYDGIETDRYFTSTAYAQNSITFTPRITTTCYVGVWAWNGSGYGYVDDFVLAPTTSATPPPSSNGLLSGLYAYYKLDEASGAGALDAGSGGRNLIQSNGGGIIGSVPGIVNTARSFPGTAMFIRNVSTTDFSPRSNHFFVTFWAKAGSLGQREMEMVSKFTSETGNKEWIVFLDLSSRKPIFFASSDGNTVTSVTGSLPFANTSTWYFIAAGWDGNNIKISVNGGPYVTASFVGPIFAGAAVFTIGSENGTLPWIGQIDEMAIWIGRNDLTISDVQQIYNNGAGLPFSSFH
jgi:hypothetical protein